MESFLSYEDEEQRKQIKSFMDKNMFVEAGAGAGKTTLIVERVTNQLLNYGYKPEELVIITFTNAAAEELRGRIIRKLVEKAKSKTKGAEDVLKNISKMQISTIHSFCNVILRERCFDAGLPVDFLVLEEGELQKRKDALFKEWEGKLQKSDWDKLTKDVRQMARKEIFPAEKDQEKELDKLVNQEGISYFLAHSGVKSVYDELCSCAEDIGRKNLEYKFNFSLAAELQKIENDSYGILSELCQILQKYANVPANANGCYLTMSNMVNAYVQQTNCFDDTEDGLLVVKTITDVFPREDRRFPWFASGNERKEEEINGELAGVREKAFGLTERYIASRKKNRYITCMDYAVDAWEYFRKNRRRDEISNDQILYKAKELLAGNPEVLNYFAKKYRCIYVDEFQDTDRIQKDFIWSLAKDPENGKLRDGALFLVGDPKQSIYRFRGAEIQVFQAAKEEMSLLDNAEVFFLTKNFRSNDKIISWVNDNFASRELTEDKTYKNMEAVSWNCIPKNPNTLVAQQGRLIAGVYKVENIPAKTNKEDKVKKDAENVCLLIKNLVEKDCLIRDGEMQRKIRYSDFLVLTHYTTGLGYYMKEFAKNGIPVTLYGKMKVEDEKALRVFLRLYRALVCRKDRNARVGATEVFRVFDSERRLTEEDYDRLLDGLYEKTKEMGAYGVADYLVHHLEWMLGWNRAADAVFLASVQAKLQQMLESAVAQAGADGNTLADAFAEYLEQALEREISMEDSENAVRLMNVHKAKGLEGNIVIWADRESKIGFRKESYQGHGTKTQPMPKRYLSFDYSFGNYWCSYESVPAIFDAAEKEHTMEMNRLEYVAATRAKQVLVFMDELVSGEKSKVMFSSFPTDSLPDILKEVSALPVPQADPQKEEERKSYQPASTEYDKETQGSPVFQRMNPSSLEDVSSVKISGKQMHLTNMKNWENSGNAEDLEKLQEARKLLEMQENRPTGNIVGNALHRCMELLVNRQELLDRNRLIKLCVNQAMAENREDFATEESFAECSAFLEAAAGSYYDYIKDQGWFPAEEVYTEYPFSYCKEENGQTVWMNGIADLLLVKRDKEGRKIVWIVDYKSDAAEYLNDDDMEKSLREKYEPQLLAYREAAQRLFGVSEDAIRGKIVYFRKYDKSVGTVETKVMEMF